MKSLLLALVLLLLPFAAQAQAVIDWSNGGAIQMPAADQDGDPVPPGTEIRCEVRDAGTNAPLLIVNSTAGSLVPLTAAEIPKLNPPQVNTSSVCEWSVLLPGQFGDEALDTVNFRGPRGPQKPALQE
jgi:hypothetical protein